MKYTTVVFDLDGTLLNTLDDLADSVENLLQAENLPQSNVLPTFYLIDRQDIPDENKEIKHRRVQFQIQNYER